MKAKLKMHPNTPKASKELFETEFKRIVDVFNRKFKGSGASLKLKVKKCK